VIRAVSSAKRTRRANGGAEMIRIGPLRVICAVRIPGKPGQPRRAGWRKSKP